ncbi:MAG: histone deacetylase [Thermoplasmata archaeon]|nr:histone deacetylase [Thermoplasmata archaeon]
MVKVNLYYCSEHELHFPSSASPENPDRIKKIHRYLVNRRENLPFLKILENVKPATEADLLRIHEASYLEFIKKAVERGNTFLGDSTYLSRGSIIAAEFAAGAAIAACSDVMEEKATYGYALTRPPGHHATADKFGGYCLFNNAAIAIAYLQEMRKAKRVFICDWDAHAGNGTMRIFYECPDVYKFSIHRDPHDFYPHDGFLYQIGHGEGRGYTANMEMPPGAGDEEYMMVLDELVIPLIKQYSPDLILGLNGFDAHFSEPNVGLKLTAKGYNVIVSKLAKMGKMVILQEGGYNQNNPVLAHVIVNALAGKTVEVREDFDPLSSAVTGTQKTRKVVEEKIGELKGALREYFNL